MSRLLDDLNPEQRAAVTHAAGPLCIVAGAGSGKTRVITRRIAWLIEQGVPPTAIVGVTFTNKAAREMRARVEQLCGLRGAWLTTFHGFCVQILRRDAEAIGRRTDFSIYDSADSLALMKRVCDELKIDTESLPPAALLEYLSNRRNARPDVSIEPPGRGMRSFAEDADRAAAWYHDALVEANAIDFDELLLEAVHLFAADQDVLARWQDQLQFLLVDEFQDTNFPQYELVKLLAGTRRNLSVTGDPDQSIYTWRGADPRNFDDFRRDFPEAPTVVLAQNYRSTNHILRCASAVMEPVPGRVPKRLWSELGNGERVHVVSFPNDRQEANDLAHEILAWEAEGFRRSEIAVMFRLNALTLPFERALMARGINFRVLGGPEFFGRQEVKDLVAYLRVLANPFDIQALSRIINTPPRGLGEKTQAMIFDAARAAGVAPLQLVRDRGWPDSVGKRADTALRQFAALYDELVELPKDRVGGLLEAVMRATGYADWWAGRSASAQLIEPLRNIGQLLAFAGECEEQLGVDLQGFLEQTALLTNLEGREEVERVTLTTIHAAKGLEFDAVVVVGVERDLLPHATALNEIGGIDEERRLFHVAMTRARRRLIMTHCGQRTRFGREQPSQPSPFLSDLPSGDVEWVGDARMGTMRDDERRIEREDDWDDPILRLSPGSTVRHAEFGDGQVVRVRNRGQGLDATVVVRFRGGAERNFLLRYAKLTVLEADDF